MICIIHEMPGADAKAMYYASAVLKYARARARSLLSDVGLPLISMLWSVCSASKCSPLSLCPSLRPTEFNTGIRIHT